MIKRQLLPIIETMLSKQAAVGLLGPRQIGKTTLAMQIAKTHPSIYLDLESPSDRAKLEEPELYLPQHEDKLVILDEVQRMPDLFQVLRGIIDKGRRRGRRTGRFLILGSASLDLLRQSSESLAGRISYIDLVLKIPGNQLWAIEIKRSLAPKPEKGFHYASADLKPDAQYIVYPGTERYPVMKDIVAISLAELTYELESAEN